jgi:hypothetical protein
VVQRLPLHWTFPVQEFPPRQVIWFIPAEVVTVEVQLVGPVHSTSQLSPPQVIGPLQDPIPEQVTVFMAPEAATPPLQELVPLQLTVQVEPPHWICLLQAPSGQVTLQLLAARQSMATPQPPAGHVILQGIPSGQAIGVVHGEQPEPQAKVQTPFVQAPPAATQAAQRRVVRRSW